MEFKKSVALAILLFIFLGIGYVYVQRNEVNKEPTLVLSEPEVSVRYLQEFYYMNYVEKATDYRGNNIKDTTHITSSTKDIGNGKYDITYHVTDRNYNKTEKHLTLNVENYGAEPVFYSPLEHTRGHGIDVEKKENRTFLAKDYNGELLIAKGQASTYGYDSSQVFSLENVFDENGNLIGFECVFEDNVDKNEKDN